MNNKSLYEKFKDLDHRQLHTALETACINGSLSEVRYLLTSSEIKSHIDIQVHNNNPVYLACQAGNLEIVKYLLTSPELKKHADIYSHKNRCFRAVCNSQHLHIAEYLIHEFKIEKNENMENYFKSKKTSFCVHVLHMFEMRILKQSMENELDNNKIVSLDNKKLKI
jgi:ankyrin repeat protein